MARSTGGNKILPLLLLLGVWAAIIGLRSSFVVLFLVLLAAFFVVSKARPRGSASSAPSTSGTEPTSPDREAAEGFDRLARLAAELALPGGRPRREVMDEATAVYAQLPPHVREEIGRRAPEGWFGASDPSTVAPWDVDPTPPAASRPAPATTPTQVPMPTQATPTQASSAAPTATASPVPMPAPVPTPAPTPAPTVATGVTVEPVAGEDVRYSVLAPDELTGDPTTPPGSVADGWYITADRTRERWHNGSAWTAHVRVRGSR